MITVSFSVRGTPTPKGSNTRMPNGATIPAGTAASRRRMAQWTQDIRHEALPAMDGRPPLACPVRLFVEFALAAPASMPKRHWGWLCHTKRPDVDKLFRALSDALTGIVWVDDSQVCVSAINKVYAWDGLTGATIEVSEITDEAARQFAPVAAAIRERVAP